MFVSNRLWADSAQCEGIVIPFLLWTAMGMALKAVPVVSGFMGSGTCCCRGFCLKADRATGKRTVPAHRHCFCSWEPCACLWDPIYPASIAQSSTSITECLVVGEEVSWWSVLGRGCLGGAWVGLCLVSCSATRFPAWPRIVSVFHLQIHVTGR